MQDNPYSSPFESGNRPNRPKPATWARYWFVLPLIAIVLMCGLMLHVRQAARGSARGVQCSNNLKQIALALLSYQMEHQSFPPLCTVDSDGKPLHSWRTLILPHLGEQELYKSIDLTKPWNDPANAKALATPLEIYHCPSDSNPRNFTTYFANGAPNGCFQLYAPGQPPWIRDDASKMLMVVDVPSDYGVAWMSPVDATEATILSIGPDSKLEHDEEFKAAMRDGSVRSFPVGMPAAERRAMISISSHDKTVDQKQ